MPRTFKVRYIPCPIKTCTRQFTNQGGLKNHIRMHRTPKANQDLPAHQPDMDDNNIQLEANNDIPIDNDVQMDSEHQNQAQNPEKGDKEKVNYHP